MWFFRQTGFRKQELQTGSKLRSAIEEAHIPPPQRGRHKQSIALDKRYLSAVSATGRIKWGKALCQEFSDFFQLGPANPEPPMFLVTLCDRRCCTSHQEREIAIPGVIQLLRRCLRGLSYLGMLEPAYYVNVCPGTHASRKRMVSWHLHVICWGVSRSEIKDRIQRLNDTAVYLPIADGLPAAHQKRIPRGQLADKFRYMLKAPRKAYRLYKVERVTGDGEIVWRFKQRTSDLRPGERLTLLRLMKDMYLDKLAVAGAARTSCAGQNAALFGISPNSVNRFSVASKIVAQGDIARTETYCSLRG
jgi:hypothetical protein